MATLKIEIEIDGAAFDGIEERAYEVARILREYADMAHRLNFTRPSVGPNLYDMNGNTCGRVVVED